MSQEPEYLLRETLFKEYNRMVRPVSNPSEVINVTFGVEFKALSAVVSRR